MIYNLDAVHNELCNNLRDLGCRVYENARSKTILSGHPDITACLYHPDNDNSIIFMVEAKSPGNDLDPAQVDFFREWQDAPVFVAWSVDDIVIIHSALITETWRNIPQQAKNHLLATGRL